MNNETTMEPARVADPTRQLSPTEIEDAVRAAVSDAVSGWIRRRRDDRRHAERMAVREAVRDAANAQPRPPCPTWCTVGEGHDYTYDTADLDVLDCAVRTHETTVYNTNHPGNGVTIFQDERLRHGVITLDTPGVYIEWDSEDPAEVGACGRALLNAAAMLAKITTRSADAQGAA